MLSPPKFTLNQHSNSSLDVSNVNRTNVARWESSLTASLHWLIILRLGEQTLYETNKESVQSINCAFEASVKYATYNLKCAAGLRYGKTSVKTMGFLGFARASLCTEADIGDLAKQYELR